MLLKALSTSEIAAGDNMPRILREPAYVDLAVHRRRPNRLRKRFERRFGYQKISRVIAFLNEIETGSFALLAISSGHQPAPVGEGAAFPSPFKLGVNVHIPASSTQFSRHLNLC